MKNLVIVESPTKAKTISKFLGRDYKVLSSYGHVRDLPKKEMGVDVEHNFEPTYVIPEKAKTRIKALKEAAKKSDVIILATDEDREGEAIAWHLIKAIGIDKKKTQRIVFHEITKSAIEKALKEPRDINIDLVDAQQARRILDRLVGYELSPLLWKKVARGLSAGRVQSVAVRLIVDREREIKAFKQEEYWTIESELKKSAAGGQEGAESFLAKLVKQSDKNLDKFAVKNQAAASQILKDLEKADYQVDKIAKQEKIRKPNPPFKTSTLQQEAANRLGFSTKQTMVLAQQLYEGISIGSEGSVGLITYMRTDSLNLSAEAVKNTRAVISQQFGDQYLPGKPVFYKTTAKGAQEAHEAIRPTFPNKTPESVKQYLDKNQFRLYDLIWRRTIACQMNPAIMDNTSVDIKAKNYIFRATGSVIKFDGFLKIYPAQAKEKLLPLLAEKEILDLIKLIPSQHFTEPPARYNEAGLVKALEEEGIGRPSTYAPTISTIQDRNYVIKNEDKRLQPTDIGEVVNDLLVAHFPKIVDLKFTAEMEESLDQIARGKKDWAPMIKNFYQPFKKTITEKGKELKKEEITEEKTDQVCDKCGSPMVIKIGRYGKFLACSNYPECKNTKPLPGEGKNGQPPEPETTDEVCDKCGSPMVIKTGRFGKFLACSNYPDCKNTKPIVKSTGLKCPECGRGEIVEKRSKKGRVFYSCSEYPDCKFALWQKPTGEKCPECGSLLVFGGKNKVKCSNKECAFKKEIEETIKT
ncbi:MAG TPA: type I DNA topoisomerase [Patescibacteria group bacterium]